jgi:S-DNA-T family DNA segregation ATPase FtsK/SpoIIIE
VVADLRKLPHLLVAGATGSGKSVCLNTIIASFLYKSSPEEVQLLMIDPKRVELTVYNGIPHLVSPVVTDPKKAATALRWAVKEMERRYELFADAGARNIEAYNKWMKDNLQRYPEGELLPYIAIIIDELADLMLVAAAEVEDAICRLAQMARAAGMCLIIATQRPSVDVITGLIKANIPSRIAFAVSSQVDSRTILDMAGAERLLGKGDMLYYPVGASKVIRAQGALVLEKDIEKLVEFWAQQADPDAEEEDIVELQESIDNDVVIDDELFDDAVQLVIDSGQASISMLQRRFRIGYSRAARLIDTMELKGIVGPHQGSKPREVLIEEYKVDRESQSI